MGGTGLLGVRPTRRSDESRRTKHKSVSGSMGNEGGIAVPAGDRSQRQLTKPNATGMEPPFIFVADILATQRLVW